MGEHEPSCTLRVSNEVSSAAWIAPRLDGESDTVTRTVPSGYPAYARICHPAADQDARPVSWSQVCQATRRQIHPLMQWHALTGSPDPVNLRGLLWPGSDPQRGHLVPELLGPLCDLLADHTSTPEDCFFCLWEGYSWIRGACAIPGLDCESPTPPALSFKRTSKRPVRLAGRDYMLLAGALSAALQIGWWHSLDWFDPKSPNLFWPADRAWCVASEIDFDSTLLGGSTELIDAILQAPTFDSWPVKPDDSLAPDADQLNRVPWPERPPRNERGQVANRAG